MNDEIDREDAEYAREKEEGFYQAAKDSKAANETNRKGTLAIGAVYALIGSIVGFIIIGYLLDRVFSTTPWLVVSGVLLGTIIGFYQFIRLSGKNN